MAFLGSKSGHEECGVRIMDYLEKDKDGNPRAVAFDCINLGAPDLAKGRWAAMMDTTRALMGNDTDWGSKRCITYNHFVISPDPRDKVDLLTLRALVLEWAVEFFGDNLDPGKLGRYEVAIVYHNDNTNNIPHAHIIVNNSDFETGRRLHFDRRTNRELTDRLQEICKDFGLSYFDDVDGDKKLREEGRYYTKAERSLQKSGRYSWKADLASRVVVAWRLAQNESEFLAGCERLGVSVAQKNDDYVFTHMSRPDRWKVSGYRLGKNYTRDHILYKISENKEYRPEGLTQMRENIFEKMPENPWEHMEVVAIVDDSTTIHDAAFVLRVNNKYNIGSMKDYDYMISRYELQQKSIVREFDHASFEAQIEELKRAREIASRGNYFDDVNLGKSAVEIYTPVFPSSKGGSGSGGRKRGSQEQQQTQQRQRTQQQAQGRDNAPSSHGR